MSRLIVLTVALSGCDVANQLNYRCYGDEECEPAQLELVETAEGLPAVAIAEPGETPDFLTWLPVEGERLEDACRWSYSNAPVDAGLFAVEDYPVAWGDPGDNNALERLLGAPHETEFPELVPGQLYVVSPMMKARVGRSALGFTAWELAFVRTDEGLEWGRTTELCE